ncbi:MAG: HAMP domain-containing sensor histidine kinase [Mycobacteriales bacterium]
MDEATAAEAGGKQFLADAARHLHAPVSSIQDGVQALLYGSVGEERERLLAGLVREAARGARLVTSLLRLARLDAGEQLAPAPCDLVGVCTTQADRIRLRSPHLLVHFLAQPPLPAAPHLDGQAVREILTELLDNARRHATSRIIVNVAAPDDRVEIRVCDDGPGLPAGTAERAFDRFTSFDGLEGPGLGLSIARELARLHGGDLHYEDGAFVLRLPVQLEAPPG